MNYEPRGRRITVPNGAMTAIAAIFLLTTSILALWSSPAYAENSPPDANAGEDIIAAPGFDQVLLNDIIGLNGNASTDEDLNGCTWSWTCISHSGVVLQGANTKEPILTVPVEEPMEFRLTLTDPEGLTDTDEVKVMVSVNTDPTAVMISPAPSPPSYFRSQRIEFSANSSSDAEGRPLSYEWTDGEQQISTQRYFTRELTILGPHKITLNVSDLNGGSSLVVTDIVVREDPLPPIAAFDVLPRRSDMTYAKWETLRFDATSTTDPNTGEVLQFSWWTNMSGGVELGEGPYLNTTLPEGHHNITVTVTDSDLLIDVAWADVHIENTRPVARITAPDVRLRGNVPTVNVSEPVRLLGSSSTDEDGDELLFHWEFDDGTTDEGEEVIHTFTLRGDHQVMLTVDDGSDANMLSIVTFDLYVNTIPKAVIEGVPFVTMGDAFSLNANGSSDEDGDALTYLWDMDSDGTIDTQGFSVVHVYSEERTYTVTLTVTDGFATATATVDIEARYPNERPVAVILGYNEALNRTVICPLEDNRGTIQFDASPSYDPDDDMNGNGLIDEREKSNLTFFWDMDADKDADSDGDNDNDEERTGKTLRLTVTGTSTKRLVLFARDKRGSTDRLELRVKGDHMPRVTELRTDPSTTLLVNGSVKFTIVATDDDRSDIRLLKYDVDFGDGQIITASIANEMFHTYMSPGSYEVKVNVTDGSLYSIFITSLKVVELAAPEVRFPPYGAKLSGTIIVRGSMQPPSGWTVNVIEVSIDGKAWEEADGTDSWEYELSTARLSKGQHTMLVRGTVKGGSTEVTSEMSMAFMVVAPEDGGTSILPILIGVVVVVLVLVGLYFLVFRGRGKKDRMEDLWGPPPIEGQTPPVMQPQFRPPVPPGVAPPATEAPRPPVIAGVQPIKEAPAAPQTKKVKVKCPACGKLFTEQDSGERPLHTVCKHCGAKGSIDSLPWDEAKVGVEVPERASEGPEPVPIICPSCGELFELKGPAKEAKCPACGAVGELDPETLEKLKEAQDKVKELTLKCPKCSGMFHVREGGQDVICPYCGARGKLPR